MSLNTATSPYLRAHKDSPVQWRSWGPEALAEAKKADKPILLSMGYAGCHWCHVLSRESFSNPEIAAQINDNFIPILADREERPDLDMLYQGAAGIMQHPGGWPLNIFLTPDGAPWWVTGYQPAQDQPDNPSFGSVVRNCVELWKNDRPRADDTAVKVREAVETLYNRDMGTAQESMNLDLTALRIAQRYDIFFGGMLGPTKFLNPLLIEVMWRAFLPTGTPQFSQIIFTSLDGILFGGAYDHIGGGFFRHSLDERWMEPAFEKMLYDQAQMIDLCDSVWQFNRNELCRQRVTETVGFLLREMRNGDVFAASISSGSHADDAKYYTWSEAEIDAALVGTFSARFKQVYGITRDGNIGGRNLPRRLGNPAPANEADEVLLAKQRDMLLAIRAKRTAPTRDDRVLADWNGLAIAAIARAGAVFDKPEWIAAATKAFDGVVQLLGEGERLSHTQGSPGIADDYADMARAALQLWEVTGDARFIAQARAWTKVLDEHFWNKEIGGYCFYADDAEQLFVRPRMLFDNPAPSVNGTMLIVLTRLALLTAETDYMGRASSLASTFGNEANRMIQGSGGYFVGFEYLINSLMIVVIGHKGNSRTQDLIRAYWSKPMPNGMVIQIEPGEPLPAQHPAHGRGMEGGQPTAYICQAGSCSTGFTSAAALADALTLPPQMRGQQQQVRA
ncbi:MAG: thioredoxin domain-containing protein [Alphaproteobacteria bacterium]|nr:thioredoxin domain-containing protein [Alphaproteobacteria bacterium]